MESCTSEDLAFARFGVKQISTCALGAGGAACCALPAGAGSAPWLDCGPRSVGRGWDKVQRLAESGWGSRRILCCVILQLEVQQTHNLGRKAASFHHVGSVQHNHARLSRHGHRGHQHGPHANHLLSTRSSTLHCETNERQRHLTVDHAHVVCGPHQPCSLFTMTPESDFTWYEILGSVWCPPLPGAPSLPATRGSMHSTSWGKLYCRHLPGPAAGPYYTSGVRIAEIQCHASPRESNPNRYLVHGPVLDLRPRDPARDLTASDRSHPSSCDVFLCCHASSFTHMCIVHPKPGRVGHRSRPGHDSGWHVWHRQQDKAGVHWDLW